MLVVSRRCKVDFLKKSYLIHPSVVVLPTPRLMPYTRRWVSRLRPFHDEAGNIGSQLIGMTLFQQENRVHCSAKKTGPHKGKNDPAQGAVDDAIVERVNP